MSDIVQTLRMGVPEVGLAEDNCTELFDIDAANEVMAEAADHIAALEARNARLEEQVREAYERAAEAAEGERYAQHYVDASASAGDMRPDIYNEACNDVAQAIRTLTTEQTNGGM